MVASVEKEQVAELIKENSAIEYEEFQVIENSAIDQQLSQIIQKKSYRKKVRLLNVTFYQTKTCVSCRAW